MAMKHLALAAGLAFALSSTVQAAEKNVFEIDLSKETKNNSLNQYDDGCYGCPVKISFPSKKTDKVKYGIEFKGSNPEVNCTIFDVKKSKGVASIYLDANVEVDSGDTCDVHVSHPNGKKTILSIEKQGT